VFGFLGSFHDELGTVNILEVACIFFPVDSIPLVWKHRFKEGNSKWLVWNPNRFESCCKYGSHCGGHSTAPLQPHPLLKSPLPFMLHKLLSITFLLSPIIRALRW
jgi:hypothetical protein